MPDPGQQDAEYGIVVAHFDAGRYEAMASAARDFVGRFPAHGKGWHLFGLAALICGQPAVAQDALRRAAELLPGDAEVWDHLGTADNFLGRFEPAAESFARSLAIDDRRGETWVNAGKNSKDMGRRTEAEHAYLKAITLNPGLAEAHSNLGVIRLEQGRSGDALAAFDAALAANPEYAWAHNNRGIALKELGRHPEAKTACLRAIDLDPANPSAWNNLGNVEHELGDEIAAHAAYSAARDRAPADPEILNNLGTALASLKRGEEAATVLREAVRLRPAYVEAWNNLGNALPDLDDKLACFRRALEIRPDFLLGRSNLLFNLHYLPEVGSAELFAQARAYGEALRRQVVPRCDWSVDRDPHRRLRIGLVSADFREHPVAYFLEAVLAALDRSDFELFAYDNERREDEWTRRFRALVPNWRNIAGQADDVADARIRGDRIDILIDLSGHTGGNRLPLFARRPAPVAVSWLGYWATTGVPGIGYLLADPWGVPAGAESAFTETVWRLPETRLCFTPPPPVAIGPVPQDAGGSVTFGCFNNFNKINDRVIDCWAALMDRLPGSRLFLKNSRADQAPAREALLRRLAERGLAAGRVILEGSSPREDYLRAYNRVDVSLDPFPYPGGTTTVESLWMGVPVLTLAGDTLLSRQGVGLMANAGLPEWIASDVDDFIDRGLRMAVDRDRLAELRGSLRHRLLESPLYDAARFAQHLAQALRAIWQREAGSGFNRA